MSSTVKRHRVKLGEVTAPSGTLAIVDSGYMYMWCHEKRPVMPEGFIDDQLTAQANSSVDLLLDGADADHVGELLNLQWHPRYLYDIPRHGVDNVRRSFDAVCLQHNLKAELKVLGERVPHTTRAALALEHGQGAGEMQMHGIWMALIGDLPTDRPLELYGERMPPGRDETRWQCVYLECLPNTRVHRSERIGYVMVDWARLMFADLEALRSWVHDEPIDGKCDVAFRGRDADEVAVRMGADCLGDLEWGWLNVNIDEIKNYVDQLSRMQEAGLKFEIDIRPHSHHHALNEAIKGSEEQAGTITVSGAQLCGFMTTWGDGVFEIFRDFDNRGNVARVRVELGTPQRVQLLRDLESRWHLRTSFALVSKKAISGDRGICWVFREQPDNEQDSGWRIFAGDESDDELENPDNIAVLTINQLIDFDGTLEQIIDAGIGSAFERKSLKQPFVPVEDWRPDSR